MIVGLFVRGLNTDNVSQSGLLGSHWETCAGDTGNLVHQ
jgi:hypothetical protein